MALVALADLSLCVASSSAHAQNPVLRAVDEHYNHLTSLRTHYIERYSGMGLKRQESGTLTLKKPGRMLWAYDTPAGKVFILDGKSAFFYTPGDVQAQRIPAKQMDDLRTPLRFLLGHTQLQKELDGITVSEIASGFRITGVPKGMQNRVKQMSLQVTAAGRITAMKMQELDGAETEFSFSDMQEGLPIPNAAFLFTPPPGVTVTEGLPPI